MSASHKGERLMDITVGSRKNIFYNTKISIDGLELKDKYGERFALKWRLLKGIYHHLFHFNYAEVFRLIILWGACVKKFVKSMKEKNSEHE